MSHPVTNRTGLEWAAWIVFPLMVVLVAGSIASPAGTSDPVKLAREILECTGTTGGLVVHVGCGAGALTAALHADDRFLVQGLDAEPANVALARKTISEHGLAGPVSIDRLRGTTLPYADNLARLVVVQDTKNIPLTEILRVLCPNGVAYIENAGGSWRKIVKPYPDDIDQWSHYLHDASGNAVAADRRVGPPRQVRWIAGPTWGRSHEFTPTLNALVSAGGRLFYLYDEGIIGLPDLRFPPRWSLIARDAFSGKLLWKRPVPHWGWRQWNTRGMWSAPLTLNRRVVTDGRRVYVTLGYRAPVTVIDGATGKTVQTLSDTVGTDEILLDHGTLILCIRQHLSVAQNAPQPAKNKKRRRLNPHEWAIDAPGPAAIVAIDTATGKVRWRAASQQVAVLTLAAQAGHVCFYGDKEVVCLNMRTGRREWTAACRPQKSSRHAAGTLVMHDGVVLFTSAVGITAFSTRDGKKLWTGPRVIGPGVSQPPDLFVADGLVWGGDAPGTNRRERTEVRRAGRDLNTGKVKRTIDVAKLMSPLHHVRCYRSKATDRFLLLPKRGVEFLDLEDGDHMRHDWLRAMCHYGVMPCNGLLYVPPSYCFCYPGVRMNGFLALAAADGAPSGPAAAPTDNAQRLERGPAYDAVMDTDAASDQSADAWPTYRHDILRSGHTGREVPAAVSVAWKVKLGGKITQATIVGRRVLVAAVDDLRVDCLNADTGKRLWSCPVGARIDSPPTIWQGRVLFGCHDGWVYCLRATDGQLAWRFRAAPDERRVVVKNQVESPWPVPGSVLVLDDIAYVAAGRSSFLDGGIHLFGLNPKTGTPLYHICVSGPLPDVQKDVGRPFDMDGAKADILVTDGDRIYMLQMAFDKQLHDVTPPRASNLGDRIMGRHLIATNGFRDDSWFDRIYWMYGNRWPGFYFANNAPKAGQILVFDDHTTYGLHVFTSRLRLSPTFTPGAKGYQLFADDNDDEPILAPNAINREKGAGYSSTRPAKWLKRVPVRARAMVLAGSTLFLAGPPDVVPDDDPYAAFEGRLGARLWAVAAATGQRLAEYQLDALPAFDGLVANGGRLYLSTNDGQLICFGAATH